MSHNLVHSSLFGPLAEEAAAIYASNKIYLDKDALVIFTCGAGTTVNSSAREQLLVYANRYFKHGCLFRAEDAFPVLLKSSRCDLLTIEHRLANYSDCVLLVNESCGTLAELGAFASNEEIVKKLLVVNDKEYRHEESFINLGPIAKADKKSKFKKTIHVDLSAASLNFDLILKRIEDNAVRKKRLGVDFSKPNTWKSLPGKLRLLFLQDIVNLFSPVLQNEMLHILKACFPGEYLSYSTELGLLVATHKVLTHGDLYIASAECSQHSYNIDIRAWLGLRNKILKTYRSIADNRLCLLKNNSIE